MLLYNRPGPLASVLQNYLEEASFMYNTRCRWLTDFQMSWEDLDRYELRMTPHLDGLALGGWDAANYLKDTLSQDEDGDPGDVFVTSCVFPRLDLVEPMEWLMDAVCANSPHMTAIVEGLKLTNLKRINPWLDTFFSHEHPSVRFLGVEVAGFHRLKEYEQQLAKLKHDEDPRVAIQSVKVLSDMGTAPLKEELTTFLESNNPEIAEEATELHLIFGGQAALEECRKRCKSSELEVRKRLVKFLAIAGTVNDTELITEVLHSEPDIKNECLLALGLSGNPSCVNQLIDHLNDVSEWDVFVSAFQALRVCTGQDYLPEFDEDEAEPQVLEFYQRQWKDWWGQAKGLWRNGTKMRRGRLLSPEALAQDLVWPGNSSRRLTHLEARIRFDCPIEYQPDQPYATQSRQAQLFTNWAKEVTAKFSEGIGYYHQQLLS